MRHLLIAAVLLTASAAHAEESVPLLYSRAAIKIVRAMPTADAFLPWEDKSRGDKGVPIDAEIRDGAAIYRQKGWFSLSSPSADGGVLLAFSAPTMAPVVPSTQYAALDVLMVDKTGKIIQIIPDVMMSDLEGEIYPPAPILALLFLRGGLCERLNIRLGDYVEYSIFRKPPKILTEPQPAPAEAPKEKER